MPVVGALDNRPSTFDNPRVDAVIISCGAELVTGQCVDTNSAWLSSRLTALGVRVVEHVTVDDDESRLAQCIQRGLTLAPLVIITGGLGPTPDDITREAVAAAIGQPLDESAEALARIQSFFERWKRPMPDSNRKQALLPRTCRVVPNPRGTAPGIHCVKDGRHLFAFPGVPGEMKAMFNAEVVALLPRTSYVAVEPAVLKCFGIGEAKLGETLADLMKRGRNPSVGTTASKAVLSIRVVARHDDPAEAIRLRDADLADIRARLGNVVFGDGDATLESAVADLLRAAGRTVSTAESCTGGLLAGRLTDIPGSSAYFPRGFITYSNAAKQEMLDVPPSDIVEHGAVSEPVARAMAENCRRKANTDYALAITGIAGPGGGSPEKPIGLIHIALAHATATKTLQVRLGDHLTREEIRDRACKTALNLLRLELIAAR